MSMASAAAAIMCGVEWWEVSYEREAVCIVFDDRIVADDPPSINRGRAARQAATVANRSIGSAIFDRMRCAGWVGLGWQAG